ncbi:lyase family protein [Micromonospora sp. NPDC005206]|uniref:lyase family protein n=1 Tax=Micromonospora sp. NPDC005206 TaxID=3157022 RepID=UPI0033A0A408
MSDLSHLPPATEPPASLWDAADSGVLAPAWAGVGANDIVGDRAWVQAILDVEVALVEAQHELGMVPDGAQAVIAGAARVEDISRDAVIRGIYETSNPVIPIVAELTRLVADSDEAASEYVHRGSTSQDVMDTAMMLVAERALRHIQTDLDLAIDAAAALTAGHRATLAIARTLTQHAVPTTFGVKAANWLHLLLDTRERLAAIADSGLPVSLAGAGGTLAAYREYARIAGVPWTSGAQLAGLMAQRLGLAVRDYPWHTNRVPVAELASALSIHVGAMGKIAIDVHALSRPEIAEVSEASGVGHGVSSAMPQKHNPVHTTVLLAAARHAPAVSLILNQAMVAEDERPAGAWQGEWHALRDLLRTAIGSAHHGKLLLSGLHVVPERMAANLAMSGGAVVSEKVNAVLAPVIGKRRAKAVLTEALFNAGSGKGTGAAGLDLREVFAELLRREQVVLGDDELSALLDPANYLGDSDQIAQAALRRWAARTGKSHISPVGTQDKPNE